MTKNFYLDQDIHEVITRSKLSLSKLRGKHIVLTGGRGFLGRYFCEIFHRYNLNNKIKIQLTVIDNLSMSGKIGKKWDKYKDFKFLKKDAVKHLKINKKIDYFIHAAGIASPYYYRKFPLETLDVAVNGLKNILELAKIKKSKVVFFSSSEIYGDPEKKYIPIKENYRGNVSTMGPRACYDESKRLGETLCYIYKEKFNLDTNIIRPFNVYGPGMQQTDYRVLPNFASKIKSNKHLLIYGNGKQTRTYCYITDAMTGFLKVVTNGKSGEAYNIGNPKPELSVEDLFKNIKKMCDHKINYKIVKHPASYPSDEPQRRCPDINKAMKHLKYKPEISLKNGLKRFLKWTNENYIP